MLILVRVLIRMISILRRLYARRRAVPRLLILVILSIRPASMLIVMSLSMRLSVPFARVARSLRLSLLLRACLRLCLILIFGR